MFLFPELVTVIGRVTEEPTCTLPKLMLGPLAERKASVGPVEAPEVGNVEVDEVELDEVLDKFSPGCLLVPMQPAAPTIAINVNPRMSLLKIG